MVRPWAEAGFECWCVDVQHSIRRDRVEKVGPGSIRFVWGDVRSWCPSDGVGIRMLFGFPPCTDLTCTGARDFQKKRGWALADGLQLFDSCMMAAVYSGAPFMIENPATSRLNTHRRPPDYKIHPWEYAGYLDDIQTDNTSKLTGLWTGGDSLCLKSSRPPLRIVKTVGKLPHRMTAPTCEVSLQWDSQEPFSFQTKTQLFA